MQPKYFSLAQKYKMPFIYLLAIISGIFSGTSAMPLVRDGGILIADLFIKTFKCVSLPIISLSIIIVIAQTHLQGQMQKIWQRTLLYTLTTTIIAATISCVLYILIQPDNIPIVIKSTPIQEGPIISYWQHLSNLIPAHIFAPFVEHNVMGALVLSFVTGLAIRHIQDETIRTMLLRFFKGFHTMFLVIIQWIVYMIPLALYGFITATVVQIKEGLPIKSISAYLLVVVLSNIVQGFIILPLWMKMNHINPFKVMRHMLPALSIAFFSKSSISALPVTIKVAEEQLHIHPSISRFVFPLCTSINMNGCAAFIFTTVIYIMQNQGLEITYITMGAWILIATFAAIGNAGIPMGCFFLSASLLASMNIPIPLLSLILPFYGIIDMIETALNVWSDICVTQVVNNTITANNKK